MRKTLKKIGVIALAAMMATGIMAGCKKKTSEGFDKNSAFSVITREDGSGTRSAFMELFGIEDTEVSDRVSVNSSTSTVLVTVAGNRYALGYVSLGSLNDTVKALKIDGAEPTVDAIAKGDYKVSRPFYVATKGDANEITQDFINFIMSTEGQKIVEEEGYIKVAGTEGFKASGATGTIKIEGSTSVAPVMEKLAEAYKKINTGAIIELNPNGSSTGMESTIAGICDLGMASRDLKPAEIEKGLKATVIAKDGIAIIVNKECVVDDLTSEQIKDIYTGKSTKWSDVIK